MTGISAWSFFKSWKKKDEAEQKAYEKKSWRGKTRDTMKTRGRRVLSGTATFFGVKGLIDYFSTPNQPEQPLQQQETPSQQPAVSGGQESVSVEQKEEEKEEEKTEEKAEKETGEETEKETGEETEGELSHQEQEANAQAERLYSEGYSDWYILVKMYQMGFVPRGFTTPFH
ncbi:MAG: hypothetical protein LBU27_02495 [Candidatus Peribacteria bacterium]|nr:hypothetical protein [Candidatus Peribacteria bacterium]